MAYIINLCGFSFFLRHLYILAARSKLAYIHYDQIFDFDKRHCIKEYKSAYVLECRSTNMIYVKTYAHLYSSENNGIPYWEISKWGSKPRANH